MEPRIQLGDYIVIQRQKYTKLQKFGSLDATTALGKEKLELRNLLNQPYSATFKMCSKEKSASKHGRHGRGNANIRLHTLELCSETELRSMRDVLGISASGEDNRHILDSGDSQALGADEIEQLRDEYEDSSKIIEKIVENSKTFHSKTEYSQDKYLRKKERKYFEFVRIRRPTIRLLAEIYYRQDADKIMGLRVDTLSQLISYAGVSAFGQYLLYESGSNGLLPACFLNSIGAGTEATLVHMHPGNLSQKQAVLALNLPEEQLERCISVNIYSVLREYYQGVKPPRRSKINAKDADLVEPSIKKPKLDAEESLVNTEQTVPAEAESATSPATPPKPLQKWQLENQRALAVMHGKFDSLVVATKDHPISVINALLPLVKPSRPFIVHNQCREVLMEIYAGIKAKHNVTNLRLTSNWMRLYQILPNRTHPEVNMNGNSGYLLSGYTLES